MSSTTQDQPLQEDALEEFFNLDPAVLKQLLDELLEPRQQNLVEEPPQQKLVDVDNETIARQSWGIVRQLVRIREGFLQPTPYERPKRRDKKMERKQEELLRLFDPFSDNSFRISLSQYDNETLEMVDGEKESGEEKGRRYVRWRYSRWLNRSVVPRAMNNIEERVKVAYYLRYSYSYLLTYFDGEKMYVQEFWKNVRDAPFIRENYEAEQYLGEQEQQRLEMTGVERPNSKWTFLRFHKVDAKVILTRSPLLGTGLLPDWLRNLAHGRAMVSLDTFNDNLCLWRCIAVHKGERVDRCTKKAREMAKGYYKLSATQTDAPTTSLDELDRVERFLNKGLHTSSWMGSVSMCRKGIEMVR